ncbi:dormancy-associated protein homolog 3-like [Curcuma longa]|uniref:dormancy-associated protein homolog 3-like n=1 Tax=Curcuma longa TaxID=136217 RepID=UPI003D9E82C1
MGLLHQLWDDTVAGPPPLGKLRKYTSFPASSSSSSVASNAGAAQITRRVTILRTPLSPAASSPLSPESAPESPISSPGPWGDWKRLCRKPAPEGTDVAVPRAPTVYDWVVISALDG